MRACAGSSIWAGSQLHGAPKTGPATSSSRSLGYGSCPSLRHFAVGGLRSGARTARRTRGRHVLERPLAHPSGDHLDRHDVRRALGVGGFRSTLAIGRRRPHGPALHDEPATIPARQLDVRHLRLRFFPAAGLRAQAGGRSRLRVPKKSCRRSSATGSRRPRANLPPIC